MTMFLAIANSNIALWNWLAGCRLDFDKLAVHLPTNGFSLSCITVSDTAESGNDSMYALSLGQLVKPYSRASANCASASFEAGLCCFNSRNKSLACFFR